MVAALFAVLASSCGNSQQVLDFRGICVDDTHGENGIYNPGRGFRLESFESLVYDCFVRGEK